MDHELTIHPIVLDQEGSPFPSGQTVVIMDISDEEAALWDQIGGLSEERE